MNEEAKAFLENRDKLLEEAREKQREILTEAKSRAAAEYDAAVTEARAEAARILARAEKDAQAERERMMAFLRGEVVTLALSAASKVMEENMDSDRNRRIVEAFLDEEGAS